jgi:hypothetical protein
MNNSMFRSGIDVVGVLLLALSVACSDDDSSGETAAGAAAGTSSGASGGSAGSEGRGGAAGAGGMYTVAQTCQMFSAVTCAKAAACGLVLDQTPTELVCLQCNDASLAIIAAGCEEDLAGPKVAATLDRCLANVAVSSCMDACADAEVPDCEVIDELSGDEGGDPVVCDMGCVSN